MSDFVRLILMAALAGAVGASAAATPKYIYSGWDLGDVSPREILMMADKFDKAPCDGVALKIGGSMPGHDCFRYRHLATDPGWKYEEVAPFEPVFREIVKHPSLRESLLSFNMAPTNRLAWTDDAAWAAFAKNVAVMARLAKRGGLKGVITDFEDYWKQKQYRYDAGKDGGTYASTCKLARQRGRTCRVGARRSGTSPLMTRGSWRRSVRRTSTARRVSSRMRSTSDLRNASNRRWG